jgi:hypothetical protein
MKMQRALVALRARGLTRLASKSKLSANLAQQDVGRTKLKEQLYVMDALQVTFLQHPVWLRINVKLAQKDMPRAR